LQFRSAGGWWDTLVTPVARFGKYDYVGKRTIEIKCGDGWYDWGNLAIWGHTYSLLAWRCRGGTAGAWHGLREWLLRVFRTM
jgi:hypothetical protein